MNLAPQEVMYLVGDLLRSRTLGSELESCGLFYMKKGLKDILNKYSHTYSQKVTLDTEPKAVISHHKYSHMNMGPMQTF